jgi:hypothetical protein
MRNRMEDDATATVRDLVAKMRAVEADFTKLECAKEVLMRQDAHGEGQLAAAGAVRPWAERRADFRQGADCGDGGHKGELRQGRGADAQGLGRAGDRLHK